MPSVVSKHFSYNPSDGQVNENHLKERERELTRVIEALKDIENSSKSTKDQKSKLAGAINSIKTGKSILVDLSIKNIVNYERIGPKTAAKKRVKFDEILEDFHTFAEGVRRTLIPSSKFIAAPKVKDYGMCRIMGHMSMNGKPGVGATPRQEPTVSNERFKEFKLRTHERKGREFKL